MTLMLLSWLTFGFVLGLLDLSASLSGPALVRNALLNLAYSTLACWKLAWSRSAWSELLWRRPQ